jgi:hypothetical protein
MNINICFSKISLLKNLFDTYLKPKAHNEKYTSKPLKLLLQFEICTLEDKHTSYLVIKMKTFNVSQFYNGFCYYFKFTYSNFDEAIKLFTISC